MVESGVLDSTFMCANEHGQALWNEAGLRDEFQQLSPQRFKL